MVLVGFNSCILKIIGSLGEFRSTDRIYRFINANNFSYIMSVSLDFCDIVSKSSSGRSCLSLPRRANNVNPFRSSLQIKKYARRTDLTNRIHFHGHNIRNIGILLF